MGDIEPVAGWGEWPTIRLAAINRGTPWSLVVGAIQSLPVEAAK